MENVYLFEIFLKSVPSLRALSQQEQTGNGEIEISDKIFRQNEVGYLFHFEIWDYQSRRIIRTKKIVKSLMETFPFMFSRKNPVNSSHFFYLENVYLLFKTIKCHGNGN